MGRAIIQNFVQDGLGNALPNIQVTLKPSGAATLAALYDINGSVLVNPITTGDRGYFSAYVAAGEYDLYVDAPGGQVIIPNVSAIDADDYAALEVRVLALETATNLASDGGALFQLASTDSGKGASLINFTHTAVGAVDRLGSDKLTDTLHLKDFGAAGNGIADDTAAINLAFAHLRAANYSPSILLRPVALTGEGGLYRIDGSVDATKITLGKGWSVRDLMIDAHCSGKVALDFSGSRFGKLDNVQVWGDQTDPPLCGIQYSIYNDGAVQPCSKHQLSNSGTDGYFLDEGFMNYGGEEILYENCQFLNRREADGSGESWGAVLQGTDYKSVTSDFVTIATGRRSFTINKFDKCNFQKPFAIAGPSLFIQDMANASFENCYFTAGSVAAIEWRLTSFVPYSVRIHGQYETTGLKTAIHFTSDSASAREMQNIDLNFGNVFAADQAFLISTMTALAIDGFTMKLPRWHGSTPTNGVFPQKSIVSLYDADVQVPAIADFGTISTYANFTGKIAGVAAHSLQTYAPVVTFTATVAFATNGDFSPSYSSQSGRGHLIDGRFYFSLQLVFDANAYTTASGSLQIGGLPFSAKATGMTTSLSLGRVSKVTMNGADTQLMASISSGSSFINLSALRSNANLGNVTTLYIPASTTGVRIELGGSFEVA